MRVQTEWEGPQQNKVGEGRVERARPIVGESSVPVLNL